MSYLSLRPLGTHAGSIPSNMGFYLLRANEFDFRRAEKHLRWKVEKEETPVPLLALLQSLSLDALVLFSSLDLLVANNNSSSQPPVKACGGCARHEEADREFPLARFLSLPNLKQLKQKDKKRAVISKSSPEPPAEVDHSKRRHTGSSLVSPLDCHFKCAQET